MALKKDIKLNSGVVSNYWRINSINFIYPDIVEIHLLTFLNEEEKNNGSNPVAGKTVRLQNKEIISSSSFQKDAYNVLKAHFEEFEGSEDIIEKEIKNKKVK